MSDTQNIRHYLGTFIGKRVIGITQNDDDEFDPQEPTSAFIEFLFEDGGTLRIFTLPDSIGPCLRTEHSDECDCQLCQESPSGEVL